MHVLASGLFVSCKCVLGFIVDFSLAGFGVVNFLVSFCEKTSIKLQVLEVGLEVLEVFKGYCVYGSSNSCCDGDGR